MRYLVTGATGFLGGELIRQLLAIGHEVTALVRRPEKAKHLQGVRLFQGDVTDRSTIAPALSAVDGVFHLAAWYEVGSRNPMAEAINVNGARNVLEEAWTAGVPRILHTSSLAVNSDTRGALVDETYRFAGEHLSEYDRTKAAAHFDVALPLARQGAPVVVVQPGVIYGPGDHSSIGQMISNWRAGKPTPHCPTAAYCWGHVEDTARGLIAALERGEPGESYILAGPAHSLLEAFAIGSDVFNVPPPRPAIPAAVLRAGATMTTPLARLVPALRAQLELLRVGPATYLGDASKAQRQLGFSPRPLRQGFTDLLAAG